MVKFVSGFSALKFWQVPYLNNVIPPDIMGSDIVEYTVTSPGKRYRKKGEKIHLCILPLPEGSVVFRDGIAVAAPEMAFLQVANKLEFHQLVTLGMQLCAHTPGRAYEALTTREKLANFVREAFGHRGRRKAMRAIKYITNASNSIMETNIYLALTLPYRYGGYSIKNVVLNHPIKLTEKLAKKLNQNFCYVDFYCENSNVVVEYDSDAYHSTLDEKNRDTKRTFALLSLGYFVISLTKKQLYSKKSFDSFARNLARRIGKRIRIRNPEKFKFMRDILRSLLPTLKSEEALA